MVVNTLPVIIDGNSLIYRNIMVSATDDLKAGGVFTGGIFGSLRSLVTILGKPELRNTVTGVYVFFDAGVPAFRKALFSEYKAARKEKRKELPPEVEASIYEQLHQTRLLFESLGVVCLAYRDREADDCVAAAARIFAEEYDCTPVVVSGDKDLWQCVRYGARVWDLNKKQWITKKNFKEVAGVRLKHYLLYKALVGDPSDGIPGASGVGQKRAQVLVDGLEEPIPVWQLQELVGLLSETPDRRKFEQTIIDQEEWLQDVLKGISLRRSFGNRAGLRQALTRPCTPDRLRFLKICRRLGFSSVIGNPNKYERIFNAIQARSVLL